MAAKPRFDGEWVHVSDAFDLRMGKTPSRKNPAFWSDGTHDWVSIGDLGTFGKYVGRTKEQINELAIEKSGIKPSPENTVLMSFKLSLGKASITTRPTYTNEAIMAFVDKGVYPVDSSFLYHQCRAKDWTAGTNTAVMGKTLNKKTLGQATVFLPEISMQKEIAARLDFVESLISDARGQLSKLDALVKSRFVEMFGSCTRCVSLADVCCFRSGRTLPKSDEMPSGDYLYAKVGDLNLPGNEREIKSSRSYVNADVAKNLIPKGAVVFPKRGGAISTNKKRVTVRDCCLDLNLMAVIPSEQICTEYLLAWFDQMDLAEIANGSAVPQINNKDLEPLIIPLPQMETQQKFAAFAAQVDKSRFIVQQQIEKLQTLYGSLAQEYFS